MKVTVNIAKGNEIVKLGEIEVDQSIIDSLIEEIKAASEYEPFPAADHCNNVIQLPPMGEVLDDEMKAAIGRIMDVDNYLYSLLARYSGDKP